MLVDDARSHATAIAVAHVTSASPGPASRYDGQPIRVELTRESGSGEWLITSATLVPALDR